jgi:hypothetical protein
MIVLSTINRLGLVFAYRQKKVEEARCTIPCRGGILGIKQCLVGSQDLCDTSNLDVYSIILQLVHLGRQFDGQCTLLKRITKCAFRKNVTTH